MTAIDLNLYLHLLSVPSLMTDNDFTATTLQGMVRPSYKAILVSAQKKTLEFLGNLLLFSG